MEKWKKEAGVKGIVQVSKIPRNEFFICTDSPGKMIGLHGVFVRKYEEQIKQVYPSVKKISFIETDNWFIK